MFSLNQFNENCCGLLSGFGHFFLLFQTYWNLDELDIPEQNPNPAGMISKTWMIPFPQANMHLLTHTQSLSLSHIKNAYYERKNLVCLVMIISYLYLFISYEAILCQIVGCPNHLRGLPAVGLTRAAARRQRGRR